MPVKCQKLCIINRNDIYVKQIIGVWNRMILRCHDLILKLRSINVDENLITAIVFYANQFVMSVDEETVLTASFNNSDFFQYLISGV